MKILNLQTNRKTVLVLHALMSYGWLTVLSPLSVTDTYFSVYLLCAVVGLLCLCDNYRNGRKGGEDAQRTIWLFACIFSFAVLLSNYALFEPLRVIQNLFEGVLVFCGGFSIGSQILLCMYRRLPVTVTHQYGDHPVRLFCFAFFSIIVVDIIYCAYRFNSAKARKSKYIQFIGPK